MILLLADDINERSKASVLLSYRDLIIAPVSRNVGKIISVIGRRASRKATSGITRRHLQFPRRTIGRKINIDISSYTKARH